MRRHLIWFSPVATLAAATAASAQSPQTQAQRVAEIVAVMQGQRPAAETFDARFLAEVSPEKLATLANQLQAPHGKVLGADHVRADGAAATFRLRFERATATGRMTLSADPPHKVNGFWITSVVPTGDDSEKIAADFAALPGSAGFVVTRLDDSTPIAGSKADEQFAVGSAFKLWVLDALAEEIAAGRLRWDQVVRLEARSPPGGITQDWPPEAAVTIETLATLMISRSDNTATDTLIRLVGRERIGERVRTTGHSDPARMLPLLTTAESFALKLSPPSLRDAYARADNAEQARILASLDPYKVIAAADNAAQDGKPAAIESVEWFASPADIAGVLDSLRRRPDPRVLQILAVAPSLPAEIRGRFAYAGYKGGSEAGVLNLTWLLRDKAGAWIAVTASWNDTEKPLDEARLVSLSHRLIALIP